MSIPAENEGKPLRRVTDNMTEAELIEHFKYCPSFIGHQAIEKLMEDIGTIKDRQDAQVKDTKEIKEILEVWNNTKGFVKTIKMLGTVAKWLVGVGAAISLLYMWITHLGGGAK